MKLEDFIIQHGLRLVGGILFMVALVSAVMGLVLGSQLQDLLVNIGTEFIGIIITVFIIDKLIKRIEEAEYLKQLLIYRMANPNNEEAILAVRELRKRGWLTNGSLRWAELSKAELKNAYLLGSALQGANLTEAVLQSADLSRSGLQEATLFSAQLQDAKLTKANLQSADLANADLKDTVLKGANLSYANLLRARNITDAQLSQARRLRGATMPDGELYDGRFNLRGDIKDAQAAGFGDDPEDMKKFYGI